MAGLLLNEDAPFSTKVVLTELLRSQAPHVPWPLHATHLRMPAMHAIWLHVDNYHHCNKLEAAAAKKAVEFLNKNRKQELKQIIDTIGRGRLAPWGAVKSWDDLLITGIPYEYLLL